MTGWSFGSKVYGGAWTTPQMRALFADASRTRRWLEFAGDPRGDTGRIRPHSQGGRSRHSSDCPSDHGG